LWKIPENPSFTHVKNTKKFQVPNELENYKQLVFKNFTIKKIRNQVKFDDNSKDKKETLDEEEQTQPLFSIVTRSCCNRDKQLQKNIESVNNMIMKNFEHIIIQDTARSGMILAEASLYAFSDQFIGKYICHLDDDDYLINFGFFTKVAHILKQLTFEPDVIIFKIWHEARQMFWPIHWRTFPTEETITTSNMLIRSDLYKKYENIGSIARSYVGDYTMIHNVLCDCDPNKILWIDETVFFISAHNTNNTSS